SMGEIALPGIGIASGFSGSRKAQETFYLFTSFTTPPTLYHLDATDGRSTVFRQPHIDVDPGDYETQQVFYPSKDSTKIPMFVSYKKGLKLDGGNPALLVGDGGFGVSVRPAFSVMALAWMEMGGVYAVANVRGGGEYGEDWHKAGMKHNKQTSFDDFATGAEWLIANKYTRASKLAIGGTGNGGLLAAVCMIQHPDLFGAVVTESAILDMLRLQKLDNGSRWVSEYGSPNDPDDFKALYAYSPLQNIKPGTKYPATLIMVSPGDGGVGAANSFKFAVALQAAQPLDGPPVLIGIQTGSMPGAIGIQNRIEERADYLAFLVRALHITLTAPAEASPHALQNW
ncbi:MAG TPA: prolyl oligopeptidase family serine peptidase, partial [Blastocatellia bacterium]|nr:prolyl oligopeptidase family serine peptidase [Blastocatellia bacterium]